jgi:spermidine/putrescine transport system permease protein
MQRRRRLLAYTLVLPGVAWRVVFFAIPLVNQLWVSLQTGNIDDGFAQTWNWAVYPDSIDHYHEQLLRSVGYAGAATIFCLIIAFPLG